MKPWSQGIYLRWRVTLIYTNIYLWNLRWMMPCWYLYSNSTKGVTWFLEFSCTWSTLRDYSVITIPHPDVFSSSDDWGMLFCGYALFTLQNLVGWHCMLRQIFSCIVGLLINCKVIVWVYNAATVTVSLYYASDYWSETMDLIERFYVGLYVCTKVTWRVCHSALLFSWRTFCWSSNRSPWFSLLCIILGLFIILPLSDFRLLHKSGLEELGRGRLFFVFEIPSFLFTGPPFLNIFRLRNSDLHLY